MKKKLPLQALLVFCGLWAWVGCDSDKSTPELSIPVKENIHISGSGGTETVAVQAGAEWIAFTSAKWITLTPTDATLTLEMEANATGRERAAEVLIRLNDYESRISFKVIQPALATSEPFIRVTPEKIDAPDTGGEYTLTVECSEGLAWTVETEEWITEKNREGNSVTFTIPENPDPARAGKVLFMGPKGTPSCSVPVSQAAMPPPAPDDDPLKRGYSLMQAMPADASLVGQTWSSVDTYMKKYHLEYSEHPNKEPGSPHYEGKHMEVVYDPILGQHVFNFMVHVEEAVCGDTKTLGNRQRNEMKSQVHSSDKQRYKDVNGNWNEWQIIEWKMKIPKGFRGSNQFTHIHQLKGQEGTNIGSPIITLTVRGSGTNTRLEVIHTGRSSATTKNKIVDNLPIAGFEDEWVQIQQECHFHREGFYRIKITRISDGIVLLDYQDDNIDLWRTGGAVNIRNKFGIYRGFGKDLTGPDDRPSNGIKDENLWLGDFKFYEKDSNPDPKAVDD